MRGKSINLFLMDGEAGGRIKCTLANWTGIAYKIPRTELDRCKEREDLKQSGFISSLVLQTLLEKVLFILDRLEQEKMVKGFFIAYRNISETPTKITGRKRLYSLHQIIPLDLLK